MPVVLDDEMLFVPPSMRRPRHYIERERIIEVPSNQSTSTIDLPPHRMEYERPHSPLVIHQEDHIIQLPLQEVELFRGQEYVIEPSGGRVRRYYRRSGAPSETDFTRRGRARSVDYDAYDSYCSSCDEEEYYIDDGFTHGSSRSVMAGVIGRGPSGPGWRRRIRRSPGPTLGAQRLYKHHHGRHEQHHEHIHEHIQHSEKDPNRHIRHLAELGLGIAAAGAAKEMYDHTHRTSSRSSSLSSDKGAGHKGRHIAAAALGATAAGLAVNKYAEDHRRGSSSDCSSDGGRSTHRGRKVAAGLGAATAAGLAVKAIHNRRHRGSRSRSSSASSAYSADSHHRMRRAVGGATAFHRSHSRSHSRPGILRHSRSSSTSSTSSTSSADRSSHKFRKAALGAGAVAGAAALARHAKHNRERSRSLRSHSRTVSPPRHRSSSRGASLAKAAAVTTVGALAQHQIRKNLDERRALSVDAVRRRRRHREHGHHRHHYDDSSATHSRRGSGVGGMFRRAITGDSGGHHPHLHEGGSEYRNIVAQEMAYRVGEAAAAGMRRATSRPRQ